MERKEISKAILKRLPGYLSYLKGLDMQNISQETKTVQTVYGIALLQVTK